jgi:hypothetical protein
MHFAIGFRFLCLSSIGIGGDNKKSAKNVGMDCAADELNERALLKAR